MHTLSRSLIFLIQFFASLSFFASCFSPLTWRGGVPALTCSYLVSRCRRHCFLCRGVPRPLICAFLYRPLITALMEHRILRSSASLTVCVCVCVCVLGWFSGYTCRCVWISSLGGWLSG
ncbi:hypothetical protein E2C01_065197 [Portunus trituberculatus]|uniref:Secreted protein n=1 Tax=Portunus trituberculatus TaxID=210409 RepID=A0A5B7HI72_PORTR|nr:hypothetical protein [Portunus trituberculatus]